VNLVFVNGAPLDDSTFASHVSQYLSALKEKRPAWKVHFVTIVHRRLAHASLVNILCSEIEKITDSKSYSFVEKTPLKGLKGIARGLGQTLSDLFRKENIRGEALLQINSYLMTYAAVRWVLETETEQRAPAKLFVHSDLKGYLPPEVKCYESGFYPLRLVRSLVAEKMENFFIRRCDTLSCVSQPFKDLMSKKYHYPSERIIVIPSCVDDRLFHFGPETRNQIREKLGWKDKLVVAYSGSMRRWQLPETMVAFMRLLYKSDNNVAFLIITRDKERFVRVLSEGDNKLPFHIVSLEAREVGRYLQAADIGLLLRKADIVNEVASPTKFAEYLRCGLSVVATKGIGDISPLIEQLRLGYLCTLEQKSLEAAIKSILRDRETLLSEAQKKHCSDAGFQHFSWRAGILDRLISFFEKHYSDRVGELK
jgi:glycosyltransferase involved in cell wall biosynthesis